MVDLEDGFSFPVAMGSSPPSFIGSPPLWRASSAPTSLSRRRGEEGKAARVLDEGVLMARLDQVQECPGKGSGGSSSEERMDMLWEDFNQEELVSPLGLKRTGSNSEKEMTGFGCVKGWSMTKASNGEKPGVVAMLKVLRKLFLVHNHHRPPKMRQGQPHIHW